MKKYNIIKSFLFLFFAIHVSAFSQYSDKWISLKYETVRHKPNHFYFQKVEDDRKERSRIGEIYDEKQNTKHLK
jgi:hypothetical protein